MAEDTPELRRTVVRILETLGYRVLEARDGQEALDILMDGRERVDLVLADLVMPRLGGTELLERARKHCPDLAFLLTSGHPEADIARAVPNQHRVGSIAKPYRLEALASRIRELLDKRI